MYKIALIALTSLPLFAGFFPQATHTTVQSIEQKSITLAKPFPYNGMSGVIIHKYNDELEAISNRVVQKTAKKTFLLMGDSIHHNSLPSINTSIKVGDKVIGGYLYNNVLLLAPDAKTYESISAAHNKNWIHPDLYAVYLSKLGDTLPTKKNLSSFAKEYQIGLIYIVSKNKAKLLDPISGKIINQKTLTGLPEKAKLPFFMNFNKINAGLFSSDTTKGYYNLMEHI